MDNTNEAQLEQLKEKLLSLGIEEQDLDGVINDINELIIQKALKEYLEAINDPTVRELLQTSSGDELLDYMEKNKATFPPISQERLQKIAEDTWTEYFTYMETT